MRLHLAPTGVPARRIFGFVAVLSVAVLSVVLALGTATNAGAQPTAVSRDEAVRIATDRDLGNSLDGVRLWVLPRPLEPGEAVSAWRRVVFTAPAEGWLVFVDPHPSANWEHPCRYLFVDGATGEVLRFDATTPPTVQAELIEITSGRDNPPPGMSEESLRRFSERLRSLPKPEPARGQAWAFIISGGANQSNNHIRYWNDCAFIYRTLVEYYGYADDHIRVCVSDGTNPAPDRSDGTNSPADLDGDGDPDIEYPATLQYIGQVFDELAATLTPSDQLFIFTTDHGGQQSGQDCYLNLWNLEELRDDQMAAYVAALPCESIVCAFEQCYSGGMIDDLVGDGRVVATACAWNELSWAMGPNYLYDTFVYHWTSAVAWQTPSGAPVDADTNDDQIVSMREAFLYAEANDHESETPQYSSTPALLGEILNLMGNLEGVYLVADAIEIDDDDLGASSGNGDGIVDFGETIELTVALRNMGMTGAENVVATLSSASPYVTVLSGTAAYGAIPSEGTVANTEPFVLEVDPAVPDGASLELQLSLSEEPGSLQLPLEASAPACAATVVRIDDPTGNRDGIADPGETVELTVRLCNDGGCATPELTGVLLGSGWFTTDGLPREFGVVASGEQTEVTGWRVEISPDCPGIHTGALTLDLTGPDAYHAPTELLLWVGPWFDDAELARGWTLGVPSDGATSGIWERADPVGTMQGSEPVQPETDHTPDPAHFCFVTGNGSVGGAVGENDVDGGTTTLLSPEFDVEDASSVTLTYWRWYTNDLGNNPGQDAWTVDVTADGTSWIHLENTTASENAWTEQTFDIGSIVPLTGTVRFRFVADDASPGSLVEAAVDDILVRIVRTPTTSAPETAGGFVSALGPCRPNPVGAGGILSYRLADTSPVRLELYDVAGRRVRTLLDGRVEAGEHTLAFEPVDALGRRIASGIYFVRMETPDLTQVRQMTVIR